MPDAIHLPLLDRISIASPCSARWEDMVGDDRVRRCADCNLNVHNLSAMTRPEAEAVLAKLAEGRLCAQFVRRADGTILTQDCPVGLARVRAAARRALVRAAALVGLVSAASVAAGMTARTSWGDRVRLRAMKPFSVVCEWIAPTPPPPPPIASMLRGSVCIMPPPSPPPPPAKQAPKGAGK
jgi:hypothetical protein